MRSRARPRFSRAKSPIHRWAARVEYYARREFHHRTHLIDPKFARSYPSYFLQAGMATLVLLAIMFFVDSLSSAAIAAGLASSIIIIFLNPSNRTANLRAVLGGHLIALLIGSAFSFLLFSGPVHEALADTQAVRMLGFAAPVGLIILLMAVTDTEHPPAGGTAIGMASQVWQWEIFGSIIGALVLLAVLKLVLRQYVYDLT